MTLNLTLAVLGRYSHCNTPALPAPSLASHRYLFRTPRGIRLYDALITFVGLDPIPFTSPAHFHLWVQLAMDLKSKPSLLLLSGCIIAIVTTLYLFPSTSGSLNDGYKIQKKHFTAPKSNVWAELSVAEYHETYNFIFEELSDLNLTQHPKSNGDNFHLSARKHYDPTRLMPSPISTMTWDGRSDGRRQQSLRTLMGIPHMVYYSVGPLPADPETQILPLTYVFNSGGNSIPNPVQDFFAIMEFGMSLAENVSDITQSLLGAVVNRNDPSDPQGLRCWPRGSRIERGGMSLWFTMFRAGVGSGARTILPQGIYIKVDATSSRTEDWSAGEFYYNGVLYEDEAHFPYCMEETGL